MFKMESGLNQMSKNPGNAARIVEVWEPPFVQTWSEEVLSWMSQTKAESLRTETVEPESMRTACGGKLEIDLLVVVTNEYAL